MEDELIDSIDAFVATSRNLEAKSRGLCPTLYLPHGVDFDHFCQHGAVYEPVPRMQRIPRPIVGFFGVIGQWVDLNLVAALSKTFPQASFVLIGKSLVDMATVRNCCNVYSIGAVSYRDLPRYASCFDIGLIPFVKSRLTAAVNPLKLLEYYALGLPVLATRLPELERVGGPIRLACTVTEFCQCLRTMVEIESHHETDEAIKLARRNTWDQRVEQLSEFIAGLG
jgi:glycosyltransferase involved in cell wall biosynthesis